VIPAAWNRWSYVSDSFNDPGVIIASGLRNRSNISVAHSLRINQQYRADQMDLWERISEMSAKAGVHRKYNGQ